MIPADAAKRRIALVDVNNFYASCETVFDPTLRGKSVVVLSNNDGCVVARSQQAKQLKIKMAQPWHQVPKQVQRQTTVFSSNYALYADMSNRVMALLSDMAPCQEVYSIDESFLDLTGIPHLHQHAKHIRERVGRWTGLSVCVGIGCTKTRAKLANHVAKTQRTFEGVFDLETLDAAQEQELLVNMPVNEVWGIGHRTTQSLRAHGITTVAALQHANPKRLREHYGVVIERVIAELNGQPCLDLEPQAPDRQQIRSSRSFGRSVAELSMLKEALLAFVSVAAEKLRKQGSVAGALQVFVATNVFKPEQPQYARAYTVKLPIAMDDTMMLARYGVRALEQLFRPGYQYKKCGVNLMELSEKSTAQLSLFADTATAERQDKISNALDAINQKFGREAACLGRVTGPRVWSMNQSRLSPQYTTDERQLLVVR